MDSMPEVPAGDITVRQLCAEFLRTYHRPRIRNRNRYMNEIRAIMNQRILREPLASRPAVSLRCRDVEALRDQLVNDGYEASSVNRALKVLSVVYNWSNRQEMIKCRNPVADVERLHEVFTGDCYSLHEIQLLLNHHCCPAMVCAAVYSGMRKGELYGLRWEDVDLQAGTLRIRHSYDAIPKDGQPRAIPLHPELSPILRAWRPRCPPTELGLVFPVRRLHGYGMGRADDGDDLRGLLKDAGCHVPRFPWHAFRHTFATLLCEAGASPQALAQLLGHALPGGRVTARYLHLSQRFLLQELSRLSLRSHPPQTPESRDPAAPVAADEVAQ